MRNFKWQLLCRALGNTVHVFLILIFRHAVTMHVWKTKKTRLACCGAVEKKEEEEEASLPPLSLLLTNQLQLYYVHQAISLQELAESIVVEL